MATTTRYKDIKQALFDGVRNGTWRPGERIPGEEELARQFGCARATVHRALRELATDGVLDRQRKSGTTVANPSTPRFAIEIPPADRAITALGANYAYTLIEREVRALPPQEAAFLSRSTGTKALHITCLHLADNRPFQLEKRWIDLETVPEAEGQPFDQLAPGPWLISHVPWTDASHTVTADTASSEEAAILDLSDGEPVLTIERRTWNASGAVTFVRLIHPGRSYRITSLSPHPAS